MNAIHLPEAPGARASRICGIWGLVGLILFFPAGVVLGIIAIVKSSKARSLARQAPGTYRDPGMAGLIMGILAIALVPVYLAFVGIVAAIAIPALLGQRARARDKAAISALYGAGADLVAEYDQAVTRGANPAETLQGMEARLRSLGASTRNPWNPALPAFTYEIRVVEGLDAEGVRELASSLEGEAGQGSFVLQFPRVGHPGEPEGQAGFLAGAVHTRSPLESSHIVVKVIPLD
nr:hypothetical protein [uncultured Holophaga sp.]